MFIGLTSTDDSIGFDDPDVLRISLGLVVATVLYGLIGVCVGSLFKSNAPATALVIAVPSVVEGALSAILPGDAGQYLPFTAAQAMLTADNNALSPLEGGLRFGAFVAAIVVAGEVVFGRRDLG